MSTRKANLGCGPVHVATDDWLNFDFAAHGEHVRSADLLAPLPIADGALGVVYSSHFLEHVPRPRVPAFLAECRRVLAPGGVLRLVLPDLEALCRGYLEARARSEHAQADFLVTEIVDQCVRRVSGGELGAFYRELVSGEGEMDRDGLIAFVRDWNGERVDAPRRAPAGQASFLQRTRGRAQRAWILAVTRLLPAAFREQNVSFCSVGERHHWLWDFHQLAGALEAAGFEDVERVGPRESRIDDFPFEPLDVDPDGAIRKGRESMFVEARRGA